MSGVFGSMLIGLETAMMPSNLAYCFLGVLLGTFVGVLPGIGPLAAMSMLFPITFYLDPTAALIMLAGIWYGTGYGGAVASILINVPGTTASAVTCLDGYPMAKQGRAGVALLTSSLSSFVGGSIGVLLMMAGAPFIAGIALKFGPAEYFSLMVLGLVAATAISEGSYLKSLSMVVFGILLGTAGTDIDTGVHRFTFGRSELADGISLISLSMGLFGIAEVIASIGVTRVVPIDGKAISLRSMVPTREDLRRAVMPTLRGAGIGSFFGALPGTGPTIASFIAYAVEKRVAKEPRRFGKGAIEGVASPESANNAADQTAFIPTMTLGIPGSATMAIMLGALLIQGITPGPALITEHPQIFWGLVMSFWIGNLFLLILNIPMIGLWVRLLSVPYNLLFPAILTLICVGVYSVSNSVFDLWIALAFGAIGYLMRRLGFPAAPLLLGFVLGPLMEEHFRRAMIIARGDVTAMVQRPISGTILAIAVILLCWVGWSVLRGAGRPPVAAVADED